MKPLNEVAAKLASTLRESMPYCPGPLQRKARAVLQDYEGGTCAHDMVDTVRGVEVCAVCRSVL